MHIQNAVKSILDINSFLYFAIPLFYIKMRRLSFVFLILLPFAIYWCLAQPTQQLENKGQSFNDATISLIDTLLNKSKRYLQLDLFEPAFSYTDSALRLAEKKDYILGISESLSLKGKIYVAQNRYTEAINTYNQLIYYLNSTQNLSLNIDIYKRLANLYKQLGNYNKAIINYDKALKYAEESGAQDEISGIYLELGKVLKNNGESQNAGKALQKAYAIAEAINNLKTQFEATICLANNLLKSGDFNGALAKMLEAKKILDGEASDSLNGRYYYELANIYLHIGNFTKAQANSETSLDICRNLFYPEYEGKNLLLLKKIALQQKDYKKAIHYAEQYSDFLINESERALNKTIRDSKLVFEFERQEREVQQLRSKTNFREKELMLQQKDLEYTQKLMLATLISGILALMVAILLYIRGRQKQNAIIKEQTHNLQIKEQNKKLDILNKELIKAKNEAEFARDTAIRSDKAKTAFLDIMSHEIRTPLSGIIGMINVLKDIGLDENEREKLGIIEQSSNDLLDIFNDILEFIKLESGNFSMAEMEFNIRDAFSEVENLFANRAAKRGLDLLVSVDDEIPCIIMGDEVRLKQILKSLVNNAIKFTREGQVQLNLKYIDSNQKRCNMRVEVIDSGIGMTLEEVKTIFKAFSSLHTSISREYNGMGLSLAIVKKLVHLMSSAIQVESSKGSGSRFWFDINLPFVQQNAIEDIAVLSKDVHFKILLAEDNELMQKVGAANLKKYGEVDIAYDGQKAFEMFKARKYDIVVMDLQMPNVNGWESTILIREYEKEKEYKKKTPIIALTANVSVEDRKKSFESGMDYFAEKPIRPDVLDQIFAKLQ